MKNPDSQRWKYTAQLRCRTDQRGKIFLHFRYRISNNWAVDREIIIVFFR